MLFVPTKTLFVTAKWASLLSLIALVSGCVRLGTYQIPLTAQEVTLDDTQRKSLLAIDCTHDHLMSSDHFQLIQVDITNTAKQWIHIENVRISFADESLNRKTAVTSGNELVAWYRTAETQRKKRSYGRKVVLSSIASLANLIAGTSDDDLAAASGGIIALSARTSLMVADYVERANQPPDKHSFPDNHLLAGPFAAPPGLVTQKWILFDTNRWPAKKELKSFLIDITTKDNRKWRYKALLAY